MFYLRLPNVFTKIVELILDESTMFNSKRYVLSIWKGLYKTFYFHKTIAKPTQLYSTNLAPLGIRFVEACMGWEQVVLRDLETACVCWTLYSVLLDRGRFWKCDSDPVLSCHVLQPIWPHWN